MGSDAGKLNEELNTRTPTAVPLAIGGREREATADLAERSDLARWIGAARSGPRAVGPRQMVTMQRFIGNAKVTQLVGRPRPSVAKSLQVQRILEIDGKQFRSLGSLSKDVDASQKAKEIHGAIGFSRKVGRYLEDPNQVYDVNLRPIEGAKVEVQAPQEQGPHPMQAIADRLKTLSLRFARSASKHFGEPYVPTNTEELTNHIRNAKPWQLSTDRSRRDNVVNIFYRRESAGQHVGDTHRIILTEGGLVFHVGPGWGTSL